MEVRVRNLKATCPCGSSEFMASKLSLSVLEVVMCASCGLQSTYGALLDQIGEEAIKQARMALERLKKERRVQA